MDESDRQKAIAEIRSSLAKIERYMPGRGEGFLLLSTGVAVANTKDPANIKLSDDLTWEDCVAMYVVAHECIHVAQVVSTRFVFDAALRFADLVSLANRAKNERQGNALRQQLKAELEALLGRMDAKDGSRFSAMHIMEAHAVLEGFRGAFSRYTQEGLVLTIQEAHNLGELYSDIIGMWLEGSGFDLTFKVLPKICWLALQNDTPAGEYERMVERILQNDPDLTRIGEFGIVELADFVGVDLSRLKSSLLARDRSHPMNEIWGPYISVCDDMLGDAERLADLAHPTMSVGQHNFMPPLTILADGTLRLNGPLKEHGWDVADPLIRSTQLFLETLDQLQN